MHKRKNQQTQYIKGGKYKTILKSELNVLWRYYLYNFLARLGVPQKISRSI